MLKTASKVIYKAFGMNILSEIPLPELPQMSVPDNQADIMIEHADLTTIWSIFAVKTGNFIIKKKFILFKIENTAIFSVHEGKKIIVSPMKGADPDQVRLYVLGTCLGAILIQRRILPLHGSAVAIDGKAYAFIGESGAGKSTLASAFLNRGYQLLTDDVVAVPFSQDENIPYVTPAYPQQKLWQESLELFGMTAGHYRPIFQRETKFTVPVASKFQPEPMPLAGIFVLVKTNNNGIEVSAIEGLAKLQTLFLHTYCNFLIPHYGLMDWHFRVTSNLADQVQVLQICRPTAGFTASRMADSILFKLKGDNNYEISRYSNE
ncbi:aldolase [Cohnella kolymensis]|uniref:Aldolase n=1 Tax=Cohnella kolymensis TaxID=1590652 RepID=A0ABR5A3X4_9BACL|nr:aldolase [Cohnella kolymensis]KIL35408.1 aldolase [Cohnella kolymensis]